MGQKLDIFKIWAPDFSEKNIYRILNLSKTINEPIFEKNKTQICGTKFK
jgi:hypothetical protein